MYEETCQFEAVVKGLRTNYRARFVSAVVFSYISLSLSRIL